MNKPRICAVIKDKEAAVAGIEPLADLFELRIDLVGDGWEDIAGRLTKPWIATNRLAGEGGRWGESEARRKEELLKALGRRCRHRQGGYRRRQLRGQFHGAEADW